MWNKRPKKHRRWLAAAKVLLSCTMLVLLSCALIAGQVMPAGAENGDGSGGGANVPLDLVSSSPANGQREVSLTPEIQMGFNKNVINLSVRDNNRNCFALYATDGKKVPIEVIMADDQLYPEQKREISVRPRQPLSAGTGYVLKISPQLKAKNGTVLGREVTVSFVTKGAAAEVKPDAPNTPDAPDALAPAPQKPPEQPNTNPGADTGPSAEPSPNSKPDVKSPTPSSNEPSVSGGGDMGNSSYTEAEAKPAPESVALPVPEVESSPENPAAAGMAADAADAAAADAQAPEKIKSISSTVIPGLAGVILLLIIGAYYYRRSKT